MESAEWRGPSLVPSSSSSSVVARLESGSELELELGCTAGVEENALCVGVYVEFRTFRPPSSNWRMVLNWQDGDVRPWRWGGVA